MRIFVDTSAFFALLDRDDTNHVKAGNTWRDLIVVPESVFVTSSYVLVESFALIQSRLGIEAVRAFQEDVMPLINVEWVEEEMHKSGVAALLTSSRRRLSLVDCVSFEVMRNSGIKSAFTFDPHFREQGFKCIP